MLKEDVAKNIALYLGHTVLITMENGDEKEWDLIDYSGTALKVCPVGSADEQEAEEIALADVSDLRYVGVVTKYLTRDGIILINNFFAVSTTEVEKSFGGNIKYEEFEYKVSCHLFLNIRIDAADVRIEKKNHLIKEDVLCGNEFLYKIRGLESKWVIGNLVEDKGDAIVWKSLNETEREVLKEDILDITSVPRTNNEVIVTTEEGISKRGIVNAVRENFFNLIIKDVENNEVHFEKVFFDKMKELRFCGAITDMDGYKIDDKFVYKKPYFFRSGHQQIAKDRKVTYIAGVGRDGCIAKEIDIDEVVHEKVYYGIVLAITPNGKGYIGTTKNRLERNSGDVEFQREQLGTYSTNINTNYFVVGYTLRENVANKKIVKNIVYTDNRVFDKSVAEVACNVGNGQCTSKKIWEIKLEYYLGKEVDVQCVDGTVKSGIMREYAKENHTWCLETDTEGQKNSVCIDNNEIKQIRVYGTVMKLLRNDNGQFLFDRNLYSHVNDVEEVNGVKTFLSVKVGDRMSYVIGLKENNNAVVTYAYDLRSCPKGTVNSVYILAYNDNFYWVVNQNIYERGDVKCSDVRKVYSTYYAPLPDLTQYDYQAKLIKDGNDEIISIEIDVNNRVKKNSIKMGQVQWYHDNDGPKKFGFIIDWENIGLDRAERRDIHFIAKNNFDSSFFQNSILKENESLDTFNWNYNVLYDSDKAIRVVKKVRKEKEENIIVKTQQETEGDATRSRLNIPDKVIETHINRNGEMVAYEYDTEDGKKAVSIATFNNEKYSEEIPDNATIYHFGILTGRDVIFYSDKRVEGIGYLNNSLKFDMTVMVDELVGKENKTKNVFWQNKRAMLLAYNCDKEGRVTKVQIIPEKILEKIEWKIGTVSGIEDKVVSVEIDNRKAEHYLSELTNPMVRKSDSKLQGMKVFVRLIQVIISNAVCNFVADIHLMQEERYILCKEDMFVTKRHKMDVEESVEYTEEHIEELKTASFIEPGKSFPNKTVTVYYKKHHIDNMRLIGSLTPSSVVSDFDLSNSSIANVIKREEGQTYEVAIENLIRKNILENEDITDEILAYVSYLLQNLLRAKHNVEINQLRLLALALKEKENIKKYISNSFKDEFDAVAARENCIDILNIPENLNIRRLLSFMITLDDNSYPQMKEFVNQVETEGLDMPTLQAYILYEIEKCGVLPSMEYETDELLDFTRETFENSKNIIAKDETDIVQDAISFETKLEHWKKDDFFRFVIGEEEEKRLDKFIKFYEKSQDICIEVNDRREQLAACINWKRNITEKYPTQICTELFGSSNEIDRVIETFKNKINQEERNIGAPELEVGLIENELIRGQEKAILYCQNKTDIVVDSAIIKLLWKWEGGCKEQEYMFDKIRKVGEFAENCQWQTAYIPTELWEFGNVKVLLTVLRYSRDFNFESISVESQVSKEIELKICEPKDKTFAVNPYNENPDRTYKGVEFYGRKEEKKVITEAIWNYDDDCLKQKQAIMISGQKRCGKTFLVKQLFEDNMLVLYDDGTERRVVKNTIVMTYDRPSSVQYNSSKDFDRAIRQNIVISLGSDIRSMKENISYYPEKELEYTIIMSKYFTAFEIEPVGINAEQYFEEMLAHMSKMLLMLKPNKVLEQFAAYIEAYMLCTGKRVVVFIDEFTESCEKAMKEIDAKDDYLGFIPNFVDLGIIPVLIGHEVMVDTLNKLDMGNELTKITDIAIANFNLAEAVEYITMPMAKTFFHLSNEEMGGDISKLQPYNTPCGQQAVKKLFDLTLGYPYYLAIMCKWLVKVYAQKEVEYITTIDVDKALEEFLNEISQNDAKAGTVFDALMSEKGDTDAEKQIIKNILLKAVKNDTTSKAEEEMRKKLLERKVVKTTKNEKKVAIAMPLLEEYLKRLDERK